MLGIRLKPEEEERLERHARDVGRAKSTVAREWIIERLAPELVDAITARAAAHIAEHERGRFENADSLLSALDVIDGGYDWTR